MENKYGDCDFDDGKDDRAPPCIVINIFLDIILILIRNRLRALTPLDFRQQSQRPCKSFSRAITTMCNSGCSDCFPFFSQQKIIYIWTLTLVSIRCNQSSTNDHLRLLLPNVYFIGHLFRCALVDLSPTMRSI